MRSFKEIKRHYNFTEEDEKRLGSIHDIMTTNADQAMDALHSWILQTKETAQFFADETRKASVFQSQKRWFLDLFGGSYESLYYEKLIKIGQKHVKSSVDAHYMNRAINVIRNYCMSVLASHINDGEEGTQVIISLEKILDINLDVITSSYIEEELRTYSGAYRIKDALIDFSQKFAKTMNFVLILSLVGLTLGVVGLFIFDIYRLVMGNLEHGIITALGSMLILWVMIELMNTEIAHLKGGKFHISVFIGVAIVAFIRETLIMTLKNEKPESHYYLTALILVLGIVYWLVSKAEGKLK